jgi:hypothetical protein
VLTIVGQKDLTWRKKAQIKSNDMKYSMNWNQKNIIKSNQIKSNQIKSDQIKSNEEMWKEK